MWGQIGVRRKNIKAALLALIIASPAVAIGGGFDSIYTFGDSLSDQGNLFEATASITGSGIPRADFYEAGRFTNGENWVDVLASRLNVVSGPSLYGGNNFAFGGTRTDYNTVELNKTKPEPANLLPNQGDAFPQDLNGQPLFPWTLNAQQDAFNSRGVNDPAALYVVFSGSNDLVDITLMVAFGFLDPVNEVPAWMGDVIVGINGAIEAMVDAGAQEILVPNMPNLGVVPGLVVSGLGPLATSLTAQYNAALQTMLGTWEDRVNIIPFDTFSLTTAVAYDPTAFGFTNATAPCYSGFVGVEDGEEITVCENPVEYVFWDREHPTASFHALLAQSAVATFVPDMLNYLTLQVSELDVQDQLKNVLNNKLDGASQKLADGNSANDHAADGKLTAFINIVEANQGKQIPEDDARSMIMRAEKVIALLDAEQ